MFGFIKIIINKYGFDLNIIFQKIVADRSWFPIIL